MIGGGRAGIVPGMVEDDFLFAKQNFCVILSGRNFI